MLEQTDLWLALASLLVTVGGFIAFYYRGLWQQRERDCNRLEQTLLQSTESLTELRDERELLASQLQTAQLTVARLEAEKQAAEVSRERLEADTEAMKTQLSSEFKLLAAQLLSEKAEQLQKSSSELLTMTLNPLRQQLTDFRGKVEDVHEKQVADRALLQSELMQLRQLNQKLSGDAENLAKALRGDKKLQGNWGEVILERVLEQSGLRKGHEYETQSQHRDTEGNRRLPDVIVHLPDERDIIIDSKVSLNAYVQAMNSDDEDSKKAALAVQSRNIAQHIDALGAKNYEWLEGLRSLDFVLMFIPIESAFMSAFESDPELFKRAYDKGVIVVSPTTLLATLKTVQTLWRYEQQNKNAEKIAAAAGSLYDQAVRLLESLDEVDKHLTKAHAALTQGKTRLTLGRGNFISKIESLSDLGARHKKQLAQHYQDHHEGGPEATDSPSNSQ